MITDIEDFFSLGCGRCSRFATADCSTRQWADGLLALRRICLDLGLVEAVKWGHPCYLHAGRNIEGQLGSDTDFPEAHRRRLASAIHAMDGKDTLGESDADGDNGHDFPFHKTSELMRFRTSHRGTWMSDPATARITRDGEVPFIR